MRSRLVTILLVAIAAGACRKSARVDAGVAHEPPIERPRLAAPRAIASGSAFDLAPMASGAVLVWGRPGRLGGGIAAIKLDEWGGVASQETIVTAPPLPTSSGTAERIAEDALEIDATIARGSLAIVWVARNQLDLSIKALVGDVATLRAAPPVLLGPTRRTLTSGRGWVALAATEDGKFDALVRLGEGPCGDATAGPCTEVGHAELLPGSARAVGVPLAVPNPCDALVAGIAWVGSRIHYGVCSLATGRPVTTVYTVEPATAIARSEDVLPGCTADGFVVADSELLVPGRCQGGRAGARVAASAQAMRAMPMEEIAVRCDGRTPVITTQGNLGATVRLSSPMDRLEALLPSDQVPPGARAIYTGSAVLVAQSIGGEVALHRFVCDEGTYQQADFL